MEKPSHTHKKTQGKYTLLYTAKSERDQSELAVYMGADGQVWVRPMVEFLEKFEEVKNEITSL